MHLYKNTCAYTHTHNCDSNNENQNGDDSEDKTGGANNGGAPFASLVCERAKK